MKGAEFHRNNFSETMLEGMENLQQRKTVSPVIFWPSSPAPSPYRYHTAYHVQCSEISSK